jgi:hypothetical protein
MWCFVLRMRDDSQWQRAVDRKLFAIQIGRHVAGVGHGHLAVGGDVSGEAGCESTVRPAHDTRVVERSIHKNGGIGSVGRLGANGPYQY